MVEKESPLAPVYSAGSHGNVTDGAGVILREMQPGSIVEVASWPGKTAAILRVIKSACGLPVGDTPGAGAISGASNAFNTAPGRFLVISQAEGLSKKLAKSVGENKGTFTDLSHGRIAIRISGVRSEWLLAKFFAVDFSQEAFPTGSGISTAHHEVFAAIQRTGDKQFDIYVFRSFARSFFKALCHAAEEHGYEIR